MKVSKEKLKQMIKEELEAVMKEGELEEIKGAGGKALARAGDPAAVRSSIGDIANADEEEDDSYEADLYGPDMTKDEVIDEMLSSLGIDPQTKQGMDLAAQLKAAAEVRRTRDDERRDDIRYGGEGETHGDPLAIKTGKRFQPQFYKRDGKMTKSFADFAIDQAKSRLARSAREKGELEEVKAHDGAEEKGKHKGKTKANHDKKKMEEAQVEELSESFRRFTKLPKSVLKD